MLGTEKAIKLATILASYNYVKARTRRLITQQVCNLWEEDGFEKYNNFYSKSMLEKTLIAAMIFRACKEREKVQFDSG